MAFLRAMLLLSTLLVRDAVGARKFRRSVSIAVADTAEAGAKPPKPVNLTRNGVEAAEDHAWMFFNSNTTGTNMSLDADYVEKTRSEWAQFLPHFPWSGKKAVQYGVSGGYLAEELLVRFQIASYVGLDASAKSLQVANATLKPWADQIELHAVNGKQNFSDLHADIFFANTALPHFTSVKDFESFLANVDGSQASDVMLQFRMVGNVGKNGTFISENYTAPHGNKSLNLFTTSDFVGQHLPHYELMWTNFVNTCCGTKGVYTGWERKEKVGGSDADAGSGSGLPQV